MDFAINDFTPQGSADDAPAKTIGVGRMAVGSMLDRSKGNEFHLDMKSRDAVNFQMHWKPAGVGAGFVVWTTPDGEALAVTLILAGIDPIADATAKDQVVRDFDPVEEIRYSIDKMAKPFLSTIYVSADSLWICGFAIGFGEAFYGRLSPGSNRFS